MTTNREALAAARRTLGHVPVGSRRPGLPSGYTEASDALGITWTPDRGTVRRVGHRLVPVSPWAADDLIRDHLGRWDYDDGGDNA